MSMQAKEIAMTDYSEVRAWENLEGTRIISAPAAGREPPKTKTSSCGIGHTGEQ
jgi:hypothetical protein